MSQIISFENQIRRIAMGLEGALNVDDKQQSEQ